MIKRCRWCHLTVIPRTSHLFFDDGLELYVRVYVEYKELELCRHCLVKLLISRLAPKPWWKRLFR